MRDDNQNMFNDKNKKEFNMSFKFDCVDFLITGVRVKVTNKK